MSGESRILVVGVGGLGSPLLSTLGRSGVDRVTIVDEDLVEQSNLHRQTLYVESDVGRPKAATAALSLQRIRPELDVEVIEGRFVPNTALGLLKGHDLVIEGADNLATKFLVADAAALAGVPAVQAGVVRWSGWAWGSVPGEACLRCLFEDIPVGRIETCAAAGVVGPVVGVLGGLQAVLALRVLSGDSPRGELWHYDALKSSIRRTRVRQRTDCPLCRGEIRDLRVERYTAPCAA